MMRLRMRSVLVLGVAAAVLAGCNLFPGGKSKVSEEERASRQRWQGGVFEQTLKPDPALAATQVALPPASDVADWSQAGVTAAKLPGHLKGGEAFQVD